MEKRVAAGKKKLNCILDGTSCEEKLYEKNGK